MTPVSHEYEAQATEYCLLCYGSFSASRGARSFLARSYNLSQEGSNTNIVLVVCLEDHTVYLTEPIVFPYSGNEVAARTNSPWVDFVIHRSDRAESHSALCVHTYCWRQWTAASVLSLQQWYHHLKSSCLTIQSPGAPTSIALLPESVDAVLLAYGHNLSSKTLWSSILRLPQDIRLIIWDLLPQCFSRSICTATFRSLSLPSTGFSNIRRHASKDEITSVVTAYGYRLSSASKPPTNITAISFRYGALGLRTVKFCGSDSEHEWISLCSLKAQTEWSGRIMNETCTQRLYFLGDVLLRKIGFIASAITIPEFSVQRFMWDTPPASTDLCLIENFYDHWSGELTKIQHFPGWRLMHRLCLQVNGQYAYAVTVYCTARGIFGVESWFHSRPGRKAEHRIIGRQTGFRVHLWLNSGEYISHVNVLHLGDEAGGPMLMFRTTFGRQQACAPYWYGVNFEVRNMMQAPSSRVTGMYYDALRTSNGHWAALGIIYSNMGVPMEPSSQTSPGLFECVGKRFHGLFQTKAILTDVRFILIWIREARITGITFISSDDTRQTLGQWDENAATEHVVVYDIFLTENSRN